MHDLTFVVHEFCNPPPPKKKSQSFSKPPSLTCHPPFFYLPCVSARLPLCLLFRIGRPVLPIPLHNKDSFRGRDLRLSSLAGSRNHVVEARLAHTSPVPEQSAQHEEAEELSEAAEEVQEAGEVEDEEVQHESGEDEGGGGAEEKDEARDERKSKEEGDEMEEEQEESEGFVASKKEAANEKESDEVEEECDDVGSNSASQKPGEREENQSDEDVESCIKSKQDVTKGGEKEDEEVQEDVKKLSSERGSDEDVEKRGEDGGSGEEGEDSKEREESERRVGDEERQKEGEEEEVEICSTREQGKEKEEEEEESESAEALQRCSLSQRKLTESDGELNDRSAHSERADTEGSEVGEESDAPKPATVSESEEEVEVFEDGKRRARPMLSDLRTLEQERKTLAGSTKDVADKFPVQAEESEVRKNADEASSSTDGKLSEKILDLSGTVSPLEKDYKEEEERAGNTRKADESLKTAKNIDRLVLHQSSPSPSLSHSSHSEQSVELHHLRKDDLGTHPQFLRPETSRGRLVRASHTQREDSQSEQNQESHPDEELGRRDRESREEEEERKKEERRLRERTGGKERERRRADRDSEEEEEEMFTMKEKRIQLLREELRREEEKEVMQLKEESEERLRALRQHLLSKRGEEEARLTEESEQMLEETRASVEEERERQQQKLREESHVKLKELRLTVDEERAAQRDKLEAQKRREVERLEAEMEEDLQAEKRRLQEEREEKLSSLKQEAKITERRRELVSTRPEKQLAEYHRELADVLQEVRDEVQRDHERKLEQLRDEHRREMNLIREKYRDEETLQKERLLSTLQEDKEQLKATHAVQLEKLRLQLSSQIQKMELTHSRKESQLQDLVDQVELRTKELKNQEAMQQTKAADLKRRRKKLAEEEDELNSQLEALPQLIQEREQLKEELKRTREEKNQARELLLRAREERSEAEEEKERLREERDKAREERRKAKEEKERLESKVALLQERCDHLSRRIGELEQREGGSTSTRPEPRQDSEKAEVTAPSNGRKDSPLHVEDLNDPPLSPLPGSQSSMDEFRRYISSNGASIQKTKLFFEQASSWLMERQAAQTSSSEDPDLQQPLFENLSRLAGERKVTFDVSESDASTVDPADGTGAHPTVPDKVQELAESLQQISGQLNSVLGALGSLAQGQSIATPFTAFPPPLSHPHPAAAASTSNVSTSAPVMPQVHISGPGSLAQLSEPPWAWAPQGPAAAAPLFSTPISSGLRASEDPVNRRWSQIFPRAAMDPISSSTLRPTSAYSAYTPASELGRSLRTGQNAADVDSQRLQGLIDGNKRWLEMRKKDTSIPLFTRFQPPSTKSGLLQLGLDDNNQIRVYHY